MMDSQPTYWKQVRATFQRIWGYEDFRPPQGEIVRSLLEFQDALIVLPTGGGEVDLFSIARFVANWVNFGGFAFGGANGKSGARVTPAWFTCCPVA